MPIINLQERSQEFSKSILVFTANLPRSIICQEVTRQLIRSGTSIGANIAEGRGGSSHKDFVHYLLITRKSAYETSYWLSLLDEFASAGDALDKLKNECMELTKIMSAIILKLRN